MGHHPEQQRHDGQAPASATTRGVQVEVRPRYIPERSAPPSLWFFAYEVTIRNDGAAPARLLSRSWKIRNARGRVEEVHGPGVVGEQPRLVPGETFRYVSACPLDTALGTMSGSYTMVFDDGRRFEAEIPEFVLFDPDIVD